MSKRYIKLQNQGSIYHNLEFLNAMANSDGYADSNGYFSKRAVAEIAVNENFISSAGKFGKDIIDLVNNNEINESENKVLQNAKGRMQILRVLGLVATDYDSELYTITDFGHKVLDAAFPTDPDAIPSFALLLEAFMGISTSSEVYNYNCDSDFNCFIGYEVCYAYSCLDYRIGVKEMPFITTYSLEEIDDFVDLVKEYRRIGKNIPKTNEHFPKRQSGNPLKHETNETRTINQILRLCGIIEQNNEKIGDENFYVCTAEGKKYVDKIHSSMIKKSSKLKFWTPQEFRKQNLIMREDIARSGYFNVLKRGGYSAESHKKNAIFSPYQLIPETDADRFLEKETIRKPPVKNIKHAQYVTSDVSLSEVRLRPQYLSKDAYKEFLKTSISSKANIISEVLSEKAEGKTKEYIEDELFSRQKTSGKEEFYPFVCSLFKAMELDCKEGVGRADAIIKYNKHSIPVEIKSFSETTTYNMKAMRQALENRIILSESADDLSYASIVVGYDHPSSRTEYEEFIDAALQWNIKLIAIDIRSLIKMCINSIWDEKIIDFDELFQSYGIIQESRSSDDDI